MPAINLYVMSQDTMLVILHSLMLSSQLDKFLPAQSRGTKTGAK